MTLTTLIAIYGGGLSTVLAILKFRETWQDRFRIATLLTSGLDNQVHVTNLFNKRVTIINYELYWAKSKNSEIDYWQIDTGSEDCCNIVLAPAETRILDFSDQYSFNIKNKKGNLYIRFYIAGRSKPVTQLLYPWKN
jgi:hypothetical protein